MDDGYPAQWEFDAVLADGGTVRIRPIRRDDAPLHRAFFERLSPETRYLRFFSPKPTISETEVEHFTSVDYRDRMAFVALTGGRIIAVARYDRLPRPGDDPEAPTEAEVAFVIDDQHQGRGIGSMLLELLAAAAREAGIERFTAEVLPDNQRMLRVFHDAGYRTDDTFADGVVKVAFPIAPTDAAFAVMESREHHAESRSIGRLLRPRSVAVIGASDRPGTIGYHLFRNVLAGGFDGAVHAVNPAAPEVAGVPEIAGVRAVPSVLDIEGPVDLAVVAVPARSVPGVVDQCAAKSVGGVVVISAGFGETGPDGAALELDVLERARRGGMRLVGPNCMGVANTAIGLNATFAPTPPRPGRVAFQSQSGAVGIALLARAARLGIGISSFVSVGNKADVSGNDLLQYWEDDPGTDVILLYLESFGNPRKFSRIARRVSQRKPIVAVKSGRSRAGLRAASSHTAAVATSDVAVGALFRQTGVVRVDTLDELFDVTQVLASQPLPAGDRVAIVGNSGGPGILAADAAEGAGLVVAELGATTQASLRALLGPNAAVRNPVDMVASAGPAQYRQALELVLADDAVDAVIVIFTPPLVTRLDEVADAVAEAVAGNDGARADRPGTGPSSKPVVAAVLAGPEPPDGFQGGGGRRRIPMFTTPEPAVIALGRVVEYARWRRRDPGRVPDLAGIDRAGASVLIAEALDGAPEGRWLDADAGVALLDAFGIPTVEVCRAGDPDEAVAIAERFGYPVALKAASGALVHKSDVGGLRLDLRSARQVRDAFAGMEAEVGDDLGGIVVQRMARPGVETIVGLVQDRAFGPLVMFGMGGVATELLADRAFRVVPLTDVDAHELVRGLRGSPLLFGYRGTPPVAVDALEDVLVRVGVLADACPEVSELDLNPVIVSERGVAVVDVKVRVRPVEPALPPHVPRLRSG
jgi:acetyl coenzyme A synthetase (ADP forming)-like protein